MDKTKDGSVSVSKDPETTGVCLMHTQGNRPFGAYSTVSSDPKQDMRTVAPVSPNSDTIVIQLHTC